jgi:hypothetical protein
MEDNELWEMIDGLWSPLDSLPGRRAFQQVPSNVTGLKSSVMVVKLDATNGESPNPPASVQEPQKRVQQKMRSKTFHGRANLSGSRFMQNFVKGMAAAFGGGLVPTTEAATYARSRHDDMEFGNPVTSMSLLRRLWPSSSRLRPLFSRFRPRSSATPLERCPLTADYETLPPPYLPMPLTLQPQTYYW